MIVNIRVPGGFRFEGTSSSIKTSNSVLHNTISKIIKNEYFLAQCSNKIKVFFRKPSRTVRDVPKY